MRAADKLMFRYLTVTVCVLVLLSIGIASPGVMGNSLTKTTMAQESADDSNPYRVHISSHQPGDTVNLTYETSYKMVEEGRTAFITETSSWRPWASDCGGGAIVVTGIDRGNTSWGTHEVDQSILAFLDETGGDTGVRDRWESMREETGAPRLVAADNVDAWPYVEVDEVTANHPDDDGQPFTIEHGDRLVIGYQDCFINPEEPGWYRQAGLTSWAYMDNQDEVIEDTAAGSQWVWICDCEDRSEAVEVLGPPPSEREATPTMTDTATDEPTDTPDEDTPTATEGDTGPGFTPLVGLVALLAASLIALRRRL